MLKSCNLTTRFISISWDENNEIGRRAIKKPQVLALNIPLNTEKWSSAKRPVFSSQICLIPISGYTDIDISLSFFFFFFCWREKEAPYADGCSQIEILQTLKEHGGSGLLPTGAENRAPLSEAFVGFVEDCLKVNPEVSAERLLENASLSSPGDEYPHDPYWYVVTRPFPPTLTRRKSSPPLQNAPLSSPGDEYPHDPY